MTRDAVKVLCKFVSEKRFGIVFLGGMAATWAVLCLACMWGLISSQGSVCSGSVRVDQNTELLCTFRACCEQDTIPEFVGRLVGKDCLVLSGPH